MANLATVSTVSLSSLHSQGMVTEDGVALDALARLTFDGGDVCNDGVTGRLKLARAIGSDGCGGALGAIGGGRATCESCHVRTRSERVTMSVTTQSAIASRTDGPT